MLNTTTTENITDGINMIMMITDMVIMATMDTVKDVNLID
jgi:hypothetical protein